MTQVLFECCLFLSGCAQNVWVRDGASEQDFATDNHRCERDVRQSGYYGSGLVGAANMQAFLNRCMEAGGWQLIDARNRAKTAGEANGRAARASASNACIAAGIKPDDQGCYACFQSHLAAQQ